VRLRFPDDEAKYRWLPMLLGAYAIVDEGVEKAIGDELNGRSAPLACGKGCSACCRQKDIPVYPIELVGIYWYATEKVNGKVREALKKRLERHGAEGPCPFLADGACSVYALRPFACRQFNVFGTPCAEGEDPYHTRRHDVLTPIKGYTDRAFYLTLPFYGIADEGGKMLAIEEGIIHGQVRNIHAVDWSRLSALMANIDSRR
jgi:Fe-S-cluster containining protein